ncbi:MAG: hypothetical protein BACD_04321 [Bacteroides rodentium]
MLNMLILDILKEYSDEEHRLTQQEIIRLLRKNYDMECDRRSVKNNILFLVEMGYEINMEGGYYLEERELEDAELRVLIDSILFSKTLSATQAKRLIKKLETFGNRYFASKVSHVSNTPTLTRTENKQVLYTVNAINDAIDEKKKIRFRYNKYGTDLKLHDQERDYVVNPYQMIAANGHYYLLGNYDKYDDVSYYRIDKMTDVTILEDTIKPMKQVKGLENGLDLPKHMAEHIYMFCGESVSVKLRCNPGTIDSLVDWFGRDVRILSKDDGDGMIVARVKCNYDAMFYWSLQYGPYVEVLEPESLRDELREAILKMAEKYSEKRD